MIYQIITAIAIAVLISVMFSMFIAYFLHRKIEIADIEGLQLALDEKAASVHMHHSRDIVVSLQHGEDEKIKVEEEGTPCLSI